MSRCVSLSVLLVALSPTAGADPVPRVAEHEVTWSDTFKDPEMKGYQAEGKILVNPKRGGLLLSPGCLVAREAVVGFDVEAEVDVAFPEDLGKGRGPARGLHLTLRGRFDVNYTAAYLGVVKGQLVLGVMEFPNTPYPVAAPGADPEGPWTLKVRLRYGVVHAKAWPTGKPEPKGWQITRYTGEGGWEPRVLGIYTDKTDSAYVLRLALNGAKPATDQFLKLESDEAKDRVVRLAHQVANLRRQGQFEKALAAAKDGVAASEKALGPDHAFTATCIHNLAATFYDAGEYEDSLKTFEVALKLRRKVLPDTHPQIATSIDGIGAALAALGKLDGAEKEYREALAFRQKVLGDEHPETAVSWNNLGQPLSLRADHKEAAACFRQSLKIRTAVLGGAHPDTAKAHNNLGYQLFVMGEYLAARPQYDAALKAYHAAYGSDRADHLDIAMVENNLAFLLMSMGQLKEGEEHFVKALDIYTKAGGPKHPVRATVLNNLGLLARERGDLVAARRCLEDAHAIRKGVFGDDHHEAAVVQMNLAIVLVALDDPSGPRLFADAVAVLGKRLPPDHPLLAQALNIMAVWLGDVKPDAARANEIQELFEAALAINRKKLGDVHPATILTTNNLAHHFMTNGQPDKAEKLLADALAACRDKLGDGHPTTFLVRHNLGANAYARGKPADAEGHLKQAVAGFTKTYGRRHPLTCQSLNGLALALAAQGKRPEALAAAADSASGYGAIARTLLAGTPESQHAALMDQWRPEVRMFLSLAATDPDTLEGHGPALLATVMDWKATSGRALLDRMEGLTVGQVPEAAAKYRELQVHRRTLVQAVMRGAGAEGVERYNADLDRGRTGVEALERELAQQVKGYAAVAQARGATPAEVAKRLPAASALIEFVLLEEIRPGLGELPKGIAAEASYVALVVTPGRGGEPGVKLVPLGRAEDVDEAISNWRGRVKTRDSTIEKALREQVWDPVAKALPAGTRRLFVAPAGKIALVPFEAVWADDAFLVERYLISYLSTGRDLIPRPAPPGVPGAPVVIADPDFDHAGFAAGTPAPKATRPAGGVSGLAYASAPPDQNRLPGFAVEADAVTKLLAAKFPGGPKAFRRADATEENAQLVARPRVLYLITHGEFLKDQKALVAMEGRPVVTLPARAQGETALLGPVFGEDPRLRSYLALTGCNHWKERAARGLSDGLLTAREVGEMDLWGTDLVVTAACKTGEGDVHAGEGVMGLRRAFQQAGARTVVTSLWSVDDGGTAALMPRFLGHYLAGMPKAEALRKAQLETIAELRAAEAKTKPRKQNQAAPFAWAAFICHGLPE